MFLSINQLEKKLLCKWFRYHYSFGVDFAILLELEQLFKHYSYSYSYHSWCVQALKENSSQF